MTVRPATVHDVPGLLAFAAEVEALFGPLVNDPQFHAALHRTVTRSTPWSPSPAPRWPAACSSA